VGELDVEMTINEYFNKVIVINLARRPDRWKHAQEQLSGYGIQADRFEAVDFGPDMGNHGCTASHRAVMELIIKEGWPRTLILEDDFEFRFPDTQKMFGEMVPEVPDDWFQLYLGGHYGNPPIRRISAHVIQSAHMKTTSSVAITLEAAKIMAPVIEGVGPIDELYSNFHLTHPCYIFQPRLAIQYANHSDLQKRHCDNKPSMVDVYHESLV